MEAIELHLDGMLQDQEAIPTPQPLEVHQHNSAYTGGVWAMVAIDLLKISGKAKRVNITLPERLLTIMDQYADQHGETRCWITVPQVLMAGHLAEQLKYNPV